MPCQGHQDHRGQQCKLCHRARRWVQLDVRSGCKLNPTVHGVAHLFGKIPTGGLGPSGSKGIVPHDQPLHIAPHSAGLAQDARWVDGSVGRSHFFLIDNEGGVWGCGNNVAGQLGLVSTCGATDLTPKSISPEEPKLVQIKGPWVSQGAKIVQVSPGASASVIKLTHCSGQHGAHLLPLPHRLGPSIRCWVQ